MAFNKKLIFIAFILLLLLAAFIFIVVRNPVTESSDSPLLLLRNELLNNKVVVSLLHSYHSIRKLPDILFFPYFFQRSKLPDYALYISPQNMKALNNALPDDPIRGYLHDENRLWVKGTFTAGDYQEEVKVKYRGTNANHWNSLQKSWRIEFPKEHLFNGRESLDLVVPYDRNYFIEPLNLYRAKKLGLTTLDMYFSRLNLNGQDSGVYLTYDRWSQGWLESRRVPTNAGIFMGDDAREPGDTQVDVKTLVLQTPAGPVYLNKLALGLEDGSVQVFEDVITKTDDATFKKIIGNIFDLKKFYAWNIVNILAGSSHRTDYFYDGNVVIIFNPVTGRFELNPWDISVAPLAKEPNQEYKDNAFKLSRRIFSIPEFLQERDALLADYLKNGEQLKDDLAFYDNLFGATKGDFFSDTAKLYNNFQFLGQVNFYRSLVADNFNLAGKVLDYGLDYYQDQPAAGGQLTLLGSFGRFLETGYTIDQFVAANPSFAKRGSQTIALAPAAHIFRRDVIIPPGLQLVIDAGATIYLDRGVSIISYSPIIAQGASNARIKFVRANPSFPWGTLAVINAEGKKSVVSYVDFDGGNSGQGIMVNGISITGMVAFHNADADIANSSFTRSGSDDGLNVKYGRATIAGCVFSGNFSDGLDMDFGPEDSLVENNRFLDNGYGGGGDALDLSWSNFKVAGNQISGCTDKGISVGESSQPTIENNTIEKCDIGIAVKDSSVAQIVENAISRVRIGIDTYQKKQYFGGGTANLSGNTIKEAQIDFQKDSLSAINTLR